MSLEEFHNIDAAATRNLDKTIGENAKKFEPR